MSEPTDQELISIANGFLLSAPPGEFAQVVADVKALLPDESLLNESAPATFREYNTDQMVSVKSPNHDYEVLITKAGEVRDGEYLDHRGKQVIQYDHIRQQVTGSRQLAAGDFDSSLENLRSAFDDAAQNYAAEYYPHGAYSVYSTGGKITIAIAATRFQPANFVNGRWRSIWTWSQNGELQGNIKITVHYYEDGNVQLNSIFTKTLKTVGSGNKAVDEAIKAIGKAEADFQSQLEASYVSMSDNTFKALRRVLPITRTKIPWGQIKKYRIGGDITAGK